MSRKSAGPGDQLTPPSTPGSSTTVSAASSTERRSRSKEPGESLPVQSRENSAQHKAASTAEKAARRIDRPLPRPLPNARLTEATTGSDCIDLTQDSSDGDVFNTPLSRRSAEKGQADVRPAAPLQRESAPVVGNPPPVEPAVQARRTRSGPVASAATVRDKRAQARGEKDKTTTVQEIDGQLRAMVKEPILGARDLHIRGWTYVLQVEVHGRKLVKIGCTKEGPHKRARFVTSRCKETVTLESVEDSGEFQYCERAEALAKLELKRMKYEFNCTCEDGRIRHTEYFDVDYDTAVRVVCRWSTFCSLRPYNFAGRLSKIWYNRLQRKHIVRPRLVEPEKLDKLMETWDDFVYVTWFRDALDDLQVAIENFKDYGSPVCSMLLTLMALQIWPGSATLWIHTLCILWFSLMTMTDNSALLGLVFRKVFNVSSPWNEHQLLWKAAESLILPKLHDQDSSAHKNSDTVAIEQAMPEGIPGSF